MTPSQVIKHFGSAAGAARDLESFSRSTIQDWKKKGRIPRRDQELIEHKTGGKLRAERKSLGPRKSV